MPTTTVRILRKRSEWRDEEEQEQHQHHVKLIIDTFNIKLGVVDHKYRGSHNNCPVYIIVFNNYGNHHYVEDNYYHSYFNESN